MARSEGTEEGVRPEIKLGIAQVWKGKKLGELWPISADSEGAIGALF